MAGGIRRQGRAASAIMEEASSASAYRAAILGLSYFHFSLGNRRRRRNECQAIMQENAPDDMRARVLAVFTLSNTGGMPIGALALGYFTEFFGILSALAFVILGVWISSALLWRFSNLSRIGS